MAQCCKILFPEYLIKLQFKLHTFVASEMHQKLLVVICSWQMAFGDNLQEMCANVSLICSSKSPWNWLHIFFPLHFWYFFLIKSFIIIIIITILSCYSFCWQHHLHQPCQHLCCCFFCKMNVEFNGTTWVWTHFLQYYSPAH